MRLLLVGALCGAMSFSGFAAHAGAKTSPEGALESTVLSQIEAFRAGDFTAAFGYSSQAIQDYFGNPENFAQMVALGFSMVVDPEEVTFLENRPDGRNVWLKVLFRSKNGEAHVLEYQMIPAHEGWKINAVLPVGEDDRAA